MKDQRIAIGLSINGQTHSFLATIQEAEALAKGELFPVPLRDELTGRITIALAIPTQWQATGGNN